MTTAQRKKQILIVLKNTTSGSFTTLTTTGAAVVGTTLSVGGLDFHSALNSRAPSGGINFPGVAGDQLLITPTLQPIGTSPFSRFFIVRVPLIAPSVNGGIWVASTIAGDSNAARACSFQFRTDGTLKFILMGATTSDFRIATVAGFIASYAGQDVLMGVSRGTALALTANKSVLTYSEATGGTPPAWTDTITNSYETVGRDTTSIYTGKVGSLSLWNRAVTDATDISALVASAGVPDAKDLWGSQVSLITAWSNGDYTSFIGASATGFTAVASSGSHYGISQAFPVVAGHRYRVAGVLALNNGKTLRPKFYLINQAENFTPSGAGAFSYEFTSTLTGTSYLLANTVGDADYTVSSSGLVSAGTIAFYAPQNGTGTKWYNSSTNTGLDADLVGSLSWANPLQSVVPFNGITATAINATSIGATTPGTGAFTTLSASGKTTASGFATTTTATLGAQSGAAIIGNNMTYTSNWSAMTTGVSSLLTLNDGGSGLAYYTAPSVSAGALVSLTKVFSVSDAGAAVLAGPISTTSTTPATAPNTGALKSAGFGFSGNAGGANYLSGATTLEKTTGWLPLTVKSGSVFGGISADGSFHSTVFFDSSHSLRFATVTAADGTGFALKGQWYPSGGLYIGSSPSDPGAGGVGIGGALNVGGAATFAGSVGIGSCPEHADNAAAVAAGLAVGTVYRTGDTAKVVHA